MRLDSAVAVVIGGGDGIGAAGAIALAAAGAKVVVADIDAGAAEQTALRIAETGGQARHIGCDITKPADLARLHRTATGELGPVDIVWAHAGRGIAGVLEKVAIEDWADLVDLNSLGAVRTFLEFGPAMIERGAGQVVITSSSLALFPEQIPIASPYVLTKAAQVGFARSLRAYLEPTGVGVTLLCPDATVTRHATELPLVGLDRAVFEAELDTAAMDKPEDVADALVAGLREDRFFVSLTPQVGERLLEDVRRLTGSSEDGELVVSGTLAVDPSQRDRLVEAMRTVMATSRQETGNLAFDWTADLEKFGTFHLYERWITPEALGLHAASDHGRAFLEVLAEIGPLEVDLRTHAVLATQPLTLPE